jgi:methionine sulfoxide reductase catalytic subunit
MIKIRSSEITPEHVYISRRKFMVGIGALAASSAALAACIAPQPAAPAAAEAPPATAGEPEAAVAEAEAPPEDTDPFASKETDELGDALTPYRAVTNYNNFYEYSMDKEAVAPMSQALRTSPWTVEVGGLVSNPKTYDVDDLLKRFSQEERIYRLRCVEAWSMVIPWNGFQLSRLLEAVEPLSTARYVRFESLLDPKVFPGQKSQFYPWPYQEGLTMAEAMNPLAIMATGLYGKDLPPQNGAPLRLVVPWKYGFKSIKAVVKIELIDYEPETLWSTIQPNEYGFYANVNPQVSHPRWSQASERRIGEAGRRSTLMFNGYEADVAELYKDIDRKTHY